MEWWNDLWLNEGFAKFVEFISVNINYPELHVVRAKRMNLTFCLALSQSDASSYAFILNLFMMQCSTLYILLFYLF